MSISNQVNHNIKNNFGKLNFLIGIFLLPSAFSLSLVFLLISLISSISRNKNNILNDKYNIFLLIGSFWLIICSTVHSFRNEFLIANDWDSSLSWIGLANWIPLFCCFYGFQFYLRTPNERKIFGLILILGTFPVIVSGLGQSFFNWNGPLETLGGLIIWYQRPLENITELTGLFNNPNYAGLWLNIVWPFCLAFLIRNRTNIFQVISGFLFTLSIAITTVLTNSRSAWIGLLLGTILILGRKIIKVIPYLSLTSFFIFLTSLLPDLGKYYKRIFEIVIPNQSWVSIEQNNITRIDIWLSALQNIIKNPLFGSGSGSFPQIFLNETGFFRGHPHNLILELMISYGLPAAFLITIIISTLFLVAFLKIFSIKNENNPNMIFEKAWIISLFILLISQMVDVQYFDGRISIVFWILLAGARNIGRKIY